MINSCKKNFNKGFTLLEMIVVLGIFSLLVVGVAWVLIWSLRTNNIIWEQLSNQNDGRRVLREVVDVVRRAEESSVGSYPIVTSSAYELTVYANTDTDTLRERVRFYLDTNTNILYQGVLEPSGSPLTYNPNNEVVLPIAYSIVNFDEGDPVFTYFGEGNITSSSVPLADPIDISAIRVVKVELQIEEDPTKTPVPLHLQATALIRNLKTN